MTLAVSQCICFTLEIVAGIDASHLLGIRTVLVHARLAVGYKPYNKDNRTNYRYQTEQVKPPTLSNVMQPADCH